MPLVIMENVQIIAIELFTLVFNVILGVGTMDGKIRNVVL